MSSDPPALTPDDLAEVGRALFGARWQTDMAEALKLGDSARIRQFLRGDRPVPQGIRRELVALLRARAGEAEALANRLEAAVAHGL